MPTRPMPTVPRAALSLGACWLLACGAGSVQSDYRGVRELMKTRTQARLPDAVAERGDEDSDPDVRVLLQKPLTAESAERVALLANPGLRAELQELGIARGQLVQASVLPNPEFDVAMRIPEASGQSLEWSLGLGVPLMPLILHGARSDAAQAELEATRYKVAGAVLDLGLRVRRGFYALLASQQHLELIRAQVASLSASYEAARALHDAGNLNDLDLLTEQAAYEGARMAVSDAEAALAADRERLGVLLGQTRYGQDAFSWQVVGSLPAVPPTAASDPNVTQKALEASLDLAQAEAELTALDKRAGVTEGAGWLADLKLGVSGEYQASQWAVGPQLSGALPVFDHGQGLTRTERARALQARERFTGLATEVLAATRSASARLQAASERATHCRDVLLPLRRQVLGETLLQYNAMQVGVFQLLQAKREELESQHACVDATLAYWTDRSELDALLAGRMPRQEAP